MSDEVRDDLATQFSELLKNRYSGPEHQVKKKAIDALIFGAMQDLLDIVDSWSGVSPDRGELQARRESWEQVAIRNVK